MPVLVDTSVVIDYLRGDPRAAHVLETERGRSPLHASEITRLEVLAGMKASEERATLALLSTFVWHDVDSQIAERAGSLGRQWLPSHGAIDGADLAIAATALSAECRLLTRNLKHFPMFPDLRPPY